MNKILIDFPERFQANAFAMWMEADGEGFKAFCAYYAAICPEERQPDFSEVIFDQSKGSIRHEITIE